jgi:hypothetical protein
VAGRDGRRGTGRSEEARRARRLTTRGIVTIVVAAALVIGALAVIVSYTETAPFCRTCHEMEPYYQAWSKGGHTKITCVDCHVDPGLVARTLHKFVALKEVWDHFTGNPTFPGQTVDMPNGRCVSCHPVVGSTPGTRFDHSLHAQQGQCVVCHAAAGHDVSLDALAAAGVLASGVVTTTPTSTPFGTGVALPGHITVSCQRCHDMVTIPCSNCHRATHEPLGECSACHKPGTTWTFTHPRTHHDYLSRPCATCHPNGYTTSVCTCHRNGVPGGRD